MLLTDYTPFAQFYIFFLSFTFTSFYLLFTVFLIQTERTDKLRQAKSEAARIIEEYRKQKEAEYKIAEAQVSGFIVCPIVLNDTFLFIVLE